MTSLFDLPPIAPGPAAPNSGAGGPEGSTGASGQRRRVGRSPEDLLAGLNPAQRDAVTHRGSPLLVVAGAGSGKTRVLTRRVAYLLATGAARPGEILAITFTNKAAAEMRERVADIVGPRARAMWVSTFHSTCVRILRAEAAHLGLKSSFTIYDAADSQRLVAMVANGLNLDTKKMAARTLAAAISALKNELIGPEAAADRAEDDLAKLVATIYRQYQDRLRAASAMDFDDLIMSTVVLLQDFPAIAEHYRRRFRHVLVDEYQDTNRAQYMLVRELVGGAVEMGEIRTADGDLVREAVSEVPPAELVVVGDADQSIYAFRGASIRNIVEFERDYPTARTVLLEQNYRSTQTILSAANAVIAKDPKRRPKNLWTDSGSGEQIVGYVGDDEHDEAQFIATEIDRLVDAGDARYSDVAIFYRTNAASRAIEAVFVRTGMPYRIVGGVRFYERREVRDALAYLRAVANPADEVSLRRVLNTPRRGIGDRAEATVAMFAEQERIPFADALAQVRRIPYLVTRSTNAIEGFNELMTGLRQLVAAGAEPADVLTAVLDRTGYRAELEASDDPQDGSRLENLDQLVTVLREQAETVAFLAEQAARAVALAGEFLPSEATGAADIVDAVPIDRAEVGGADQPAGDDAESVVDAGAAPGISSQQVLSAVLEQIALVADADAIPDSTEGVVTLMTLHTAKGLEFPVVFVTGWEDGIFPHQRSLGDEKQLAEERRLAYVGITRAQRRLYVSRAVYRSAWGQQSSNPASRFLQDIPDSLVDWRRLAEAADRMGADEIWEPDSFSGSYGGRGGSSVRTGWSRQSGGSGYGARSSASSTGRAAPVTASRFGSGVRPPGRSSGPVGSGPVLQLAAGDRVSHDKYGLGSVRSVEGTGIRATAVIDFGTAGTVRLMLIGGVPMVKL